MTLKTCKTAVCASAFLAAVAWSGGAFATSVASNSYDFETDGTLGTSPYEALSGNGTIVADTTVGDYNARVGKPMSSSAHTKVLEVAGTVTYTNAGDTSDSTSSQVDFLFRAEPTDELEAPEGNDIQVALAVGPQNENATTAPLKLWCKTAADSATAGWVDLKTVTTGAWVRATLVMDYSGSDKKCRVSLDGSPVLNNGSEWFYFAGTAQQQFVKSVEMIGSTKVDDFVVSYSDNYEIPGGSRTVATDSIVTYDYINKYGVTVDQATSSTPLDDSGMTVAQKYVAGLDPKSGTKFELKTMNATSATSATVTFPGNYDTGYTVTVKNAAGTTRSTQTTSTAAGTVAGGETLRSATVTLPADELVYITVEATK